MRKALLIDAVALVFYTAASLPSLTSIFVHEWLGIAVFVVLVVHCAQHADWIIETMRSFVKSGSPARKARLALFVGLSLSLTVVMVSGLLISGAVLPAFGVFAGGYYFWNPLHAASAKVFLAFLLVHLVVDVGRAVRLWRRGRRDSKTNCTESSGEDGL